MKKLSFSFLCTVLVFQGFGQCLWENVGPNSFSSEEIVSTFYEPAIVVNQGVPVVCYPEPGLQLKFKTFNGFVWSDLVSLAGQYAIGSGSLCSVDGGLIAAVAEFDGFGASELKVFEIQNGALNQVGGSLDPIIAASFNIDLKQNPVNGQLYVAYCRKESENNDVYFPNVKHFNGGWSSVGAPDFFGETVRYISLDFNSVGFPVVAFRGDQQNGAVSVVQYNGVEWLSVGSQAFAGVQVSDIELFIHEDVPYVVFSDGAGVSFYRFNGGSWVLVHQMVDFSDAKIDLSTEGGNVILSLNTSSLVSLFEFDLVLQNTQQLGSDFLGGKVSLSYSQNLFVVFGDPFVNVVKLLCQENLGCTYPIAINYNPLATDDDGSCEFDLCPCNNCAADLNLDGLVNTGDLTILLSGFGAACP